MTILVIGQGAHLEATYQLACGQLRGPVKPVFLSLSAARDWLRTHEADLIVLDDEPGAPALELIRQARQVPTRLEMPILVVTETAAHDWRQQALEAGASDYLLKPFSAAEAGARLRTVLAARQAARRVLHTDMQLADLRADVAAVEQEIAFRLTKVAYFCDPVTGAHLLRMPHYAKHIARHLGLSEDEQELVLRAAPLHDVGTISVPKEILAKASEHTAAEVAALRLHTLHGYDLLMDSSSRLLQAAATIALSHHEHFDGSGYPQGLAGEDIPLMGRIVAVADTFDDYLTGRPYRPAWDQDRIRAKIASESGQMFDPRCVQAFLQDWETVQLIVQMF